jgi:phage baseplate assembly protein W
MMSRDTGRRLDEVDHIRQSIRDILTTPVGSRIMRRDYGSLLPELIDQPSNPANRLRLMAATVMAIIQWEPRVSVNNVDIAIGIDGSATIDLDLSRRTGPAAGQKLSMAYSLS